MDWKVGMASSALANSVRISSSSEDAIAGLRDLVQNMARELLK
jgi:hypothetical protein